MIRNFYVNLEEQTKKIEREKSVVVDRIKRMC